MENERRAVLERVARGELTPAEAAALLEDMESNQPGSTPESPAADWSRPSGWENWNTSAGPAPGGGPPTATVTGERAARIRVIRAIGKAEIIGDPTVHEAVAEGPHTARRQGDTLIIERDEGDWALGAFQFNFRGRHPRPPRPRHFHWGDMMPLRVRVNPDLALEVEAQAGKLTIRGVNGPIRADVQAGSTDIDGFRSPIELSSQAGSVRARGRLDHGRSRISCEAGSVRLHLEQGSSVRVSARTTLGKVSFDGDTNPWVIGGGEATLDIDATMGSVRVTTDE
jgi:hypothetical protein